MRIVTPLPPIGIIESARLNLTESWENLYTVPFYANTAEQFEGFVLASSSITSLLVGNESNVDGRFSVRVLSGRPSGKLKGLIAGPGTNRLEFKGYGPNDNVGAAIDSVKLLDSFGNDYIVNGSFEDVTGLTQTGYGYFGEGAIPGWTDYVPTTYLDIHQDTRLGVIPTDGISWLDTRGFYDPAHPNGGNIHVYQDIPGLSSGSPYTLRFDFGDDGDRGNRIEVYWNGELLNIDGETQINPVKIYLLFQDVVVPPGDFASLEISKSLLNSSDNLQVKAENSSSMSAHLSINRKTQEAFSVL
jgi:hypothetical protein